MGLVLQPSLMQSTKIIVLRGFILGQAGEDPVERFAQLDRPTKDRFELNRYLFPFRQQILSPIPIQDANMTAPQNHIAVIHKIFMDRVAMSI